MSLTGQENSVAQLALTIPAHPTTADILRVLVQAEQAGYERAKQECPACLAKFPYSLCGSELPSILKRQAT